MTHFIDEETELQRFFLEIAGLPRWHTVKRLCLLMQETQEMSAIPGLGRSPGEGNDNPCQYFCIGNPMDRGAWQATATTTTPFFIMRVLKSSTFSPFTQTSSLHHLYWSLKYPFDWALHHSSHCLWIHLVSLTLLTHFFLPYSVPLQHIFYYTKFSKTWHF